MKTYQYTALPDKVKTRLRDNLSIHTYQYFMSIAMTPSGWCMLLDKYDLYDNEMKNEFFPLFMSDE